MDAKANAGIPFPEVIIYVDNLQNHDFNGRATSPYFGSRKFTNIFSLVIALEAHYNQLQFPQNTLQMRSFIDQPKKKEAVKEKTIMPNSKDYPTNDSPTLYSIENETPGNQATFVVNVRFRQNATWQGSVQWVDENRTQNFRSTLELITLMESALVKKNETMVSNGWETPEEKIE